MYCPQCDLQVEQSCTKRGCPVDGIILGHNIRLERDALLVERQKTHGDFGRNALISQELKTTFVRYGSKEFSQAHREALDMIALKLSRILSGQANFKDHWDDVAGYAKLASEACD